jgi:hypothetical protein
MRVNRRALPYVLSVVDRYGSGPDHEQPVATPPCCDRRSAVDFYPGSPQSPNIWRGDFSPRIEPRTAHARVIAKRHSFACFQRDLG